VNLDAVEDIAGREQCLWLIIELPARDGSDRMSAADQMGCQVTDELTRCGVIRRKVAIYKEDPSHRSMWPYATRWGTGGTSGSCLFLVIDDDDG
jgi:hypothetical protein